MMSAKAITIIDEYLVYNRIRSQKDSITNNRYKYVDCAYSVLSGLKEYLISKGVYERYKRDFICYAISLMRHTHSGNISDPNIEKDMQNKIILWLEEFDITGHPRDYYYCIEVYEKLLREIKPKKADAE